MRLFLLLGLLLKMSLLQAGELYGEINQPNFDEAKNSEHQIRFEVFSTKLGLFTTRVPGYVLKAQATAQRNGNVLKQLKLKMVSNSLNTDNDSRDEKLHNLCLSTDQYPEIIVEVSAAAILGEEGMYPGKINIRGREKEIIIKLKLEEQGGRVIATGDSQLTVSDLEIPDPSISIAKLENNINIIFKIIVSER